MRRSRQEMELYAHSWACQVEECGMHFITFSKHQGDAPDLIACPLCHVVGRFKHWRVRLPEGTQLRALHPWPGSRRVDAQDARRLQRMLALSTPNAQESYERTGVAPWAIDQRPQSQWPEYMAKLRWEITHDTDEA